MSERLEELRATFVIEGIDECLQLVQKVERMAPEVAQMIMGDIALICPTPVVGPLVGFAMSLARGVYGAFMGRSNAKPSMVNEVSRITADVKQRLQELQAGSKGPNKSSVMKCYEPILRYHMLFEISPKDQTG